MWFVPLPTLSLHVQVQIEAQTFATRARVFLQCQAPAIASLQSIHHVRSVTSGALGMTISDSMTVHPRSRLTMPDLAVCSVTVCVLSRAPCLTHDTEKASPAAASIN